jgi:uncharacterized protein YodC (DUF2158 family)
MDDESEQGFRQSPQEMDYVLRRDAFPLDELVKVPAPKRPVVLKSGGPVMDLETVEGENALCSWYGADMKLARAVFPLACLYECKPLEQEA